MLNANFTMCFIDVMALVPELLTNIVMSTSSRTDALRSMLHAKYDNKEISGETIPEFQLFLEMKFNQYKDYYEQLLDVYESEIDWQTGEKLTLSDITSGGKTVVYQPRAKYSSTDTYTPDMTSETTRYDLPRYASENNHPTEIDTTSNTGTAVSSKESGGESGEDTTTDTNSGTLSRDSSRVNLVTQKKKMMEMLRNVYDEFADKFKACFLDLYF